MRRPGLRLAALGAAVGAWAIIPPYVGPEFHTSALVEIVDHVVPGSLVLLLCAIAIGGARASERYMLGTGLVVLLAALWVTMTHVPLVAQAVRGDVGMGVAVYHILPGIALLGLGAAWTARFARTGAVRADR